MLYSEAKAIIESMTCFPGSRIEVTTPLFSDDQMFGWAIIGVSVLCHDIASDGTIPIERALYISDVELAHITPHLLVQRVRAYLYSLMQHEVDEHFKVDGKLVTEPHPEYHGEHARCWSCAVPR